MSPYTPTSGQGEPLEYHYRTFEGEARKALVGVDSIDMTGAWSVYDVPAAGDHTHGWLVERLDGHDDKLGEATFLAAEYAADQQRFHNNERGEESIPDPLPRPMVDSEGHRQPVTVPIGEIRQHAALARQHANCDSHAVAA
ncbi:MAG TPA: hypothetical protein VGL57_13335 [Solirubrobacteraceae bacterium]|jgi:hypothetical protein